MSAPTAFRVYKNAAEDVPGSSVTLTDDGGLGTIIVDGSGPILATKSITAGAGIQVQSFVNNVAIVNTSPATDVVLSSAGGTTLVTDGTGPTLAVKGLSAGTNISVVDSGTALTINNTAPAAATVTLGTGAGEQSLVETGVGPALTTKALVAGNAIDLTGAASNVTIAVEAATTNAIATNTSGVSTNASSITTINANFDYQTQVMTWENDGLGVASTTLLITQVWAFQRIGNVVYVTATVSTMDPTFTGNTDQKILSNTAPPAWAQPVSTTTNSLMWTQNSASDQTLSLDINTSAPWFELSPIIGTTFIGDVRINHNSFSYRVD